MPDLEFILTHAPIPADLVPFDGRFGAELVFVGVVRELEQGEKISGIEYSAYPAMVDASIEKISRQASAKFAPHRAKMIHRLGFVPAAEPSLHLQVSSAHSSAAFEICQWLVAELKRAVPIWKRTIPFP